MTCPAEEFFRIPELAEQVVQHLTHHDILQCMKTCKTLYNLKEYLFHYVDLGERYPAPSDLTRYRYHVRTLLDPCDEPAYFEAIAKDLPHRTLPKAGSGTEELGPSSSYSSSMDKHVLHHLQSISLKCISAVGAGYLNRFSLARHRDILSMFYRSTIRMPSSDNLNTCTNYFLRILDYSPYVHTLTLMAEILSLQDPTMVEQFMDTLANKTPSLKRLRLSGGHIPPEIGFRFLEICFKHPRLAHLDCDFEAGGQDSNTTSIESIRDTFLKSLDDARQSRSKPEAEPWASRIESLQLPYIKTGYPEAYLISLLRSYVPRLKSFFIPTVSSIMRTQEIGKAIALGCKELDSIICGGALGYYVDGLIVEAIIQACAVQNGGCGIRMFRATRWGDWDPPQGDFQTLISCHSETLERIELDETGLVESADLMGIFTSCKKLKVFTVDVTEGGQGAITFEDVIGKEWVCRDLEILCIVLNRHNSLVEDEYEHDEMDENPNQDMDNGTRGEEDEQSQSNEEKERNQRNEDECPDDEYRYPEDEYNYLKYTLGFWSHPRPRESEAMRRGAQQVYAQIGRMTKLRKLSLGWDENIDAVSRAKDFKFDLTLKYGWLSELVGLKQLRHFEMLNNFWSHIDQAEVEFMHANWPKLEKISFAVQDLGRETRKRHWAWLQEKRPNLKFERRKFFLQIRLEQQERE